MLLGGNLGVTSNKSEGTSIKSNSILVSPSAGIAIARNTIVGIGLAYSHGRSDYLDPNTGTKYNLYGGSVFVRRYLALGKGFYLFGEGDLYSQGSKITTTTPSMENGQKNWVLGINIYPGISYAINKWFQLEAALPQLANLSYMKTTNFSNGASTQIINSLGFNAAASSLSNISVGFRFLIAKG